MTPLGIAIWSEALVGRQTGTHTFLVNICSRLIRDYAATVCLTFVVPDAADVATLKNLLPEGAWRVAVVPRHKWRQRLGWLAGLGSISPQIGPHDLYLSGWHWPLGARDVPFVGIMHDLRPLDAASWDPTIGRLRNLIWKALYHASARACLRRAAAVVSVSQYTLDHIRRIGFAPRQETRVIWHGIDRAAWGTPPDAERRIALRAAYGLAPDQRFAITIGQHVPHKNTHRLVEAFARGVARRDSAGCLLLAGGRNAETARIAATIEAQGLGDRVRILGFVPFADLTSLVQEAHVFAFVSLFEGFGLPVAEAFAARTPVLTSATTSLIEVAGDAALTIDPTDVGAISEGLLRLWDDDTLRDRLVTAGAERVQLFDWDTATAAYVTLFRDLAGS